MQTEYKILLLTELDSQESIYYLKAAIEILQTHDRNIFQLYSQSVKQFTSTKYYDESIKLDYIICIGENKTLMKAFRILTRNGQIPIVSISNGNEPILSSYSSCQLYQVIQNFAQKVKRNEIKVQKCVNFNIFPEGTKKVLTNFASQLQIFRGMDQSVIRLNIYIKTQGKDFTFLAPLWGDGLIIASPLGSLGRSMSLNGPIMHKQLQNLIIVPNCPLSLTFRPICLPANAQILIQVEDTSRSSAKLFIDGQQIEQLPKGKRIRISRNSEKQTQFVKQLLPKTTEESWIISLQQVIGWGEQFSSNKTISAIMQEQEKMM